MNVRCYPMTEPLSVVYGDMVRIRYGNIQMPHHVINNGAPDVGGMFTTVKYK